MAAYFNPLITVPGDLLVNANNNYVECFNNNIAATNYAKRVNSYNRGSYTTRVAMAVIKYNNKTSMSDVYKVMGKHVPQQPSQMEEKRYQRKVDYNRRYYEQGSHNRHSKKQSYSHDSDYGRSAGISVTAKEYEDLLKLHRTKLLNFQKDRIQLSVVLLNKHTVKIGILYADYL